MGAHTNSTKAACFSLHFLFFLIALTLCFQNVLSEKDFSSMYSPSERAALDRLRPMVKELLYKDYMNTDEYLIPFLRERKFNLMDTREMIKRAHQWRRENRIDTILKEDMSQLQKYFPYFADGIDVEGRPVLTWNFGKWDIRRIAVAGRMDLLQRFTVRMLEEGFVKIREQRAATGKYITQCQIIIDGNGYSLRQHACVSCLPFYYNFITVNDLYYPHLTKNIHLINVPRIFESLLNLIRPIMSEYTRDAVKTYGYNKDEWRREFFETIPEDQIRPVFGGTKMP